MVLRLCFTAMVGLLLSATTLLSQDQFEMSRLVKLGGELQKQGRFVEAIDTYNRAGEIALNVFGPNHKYTATLYALSGGIYRQLGRFPEAEQKLEKSLAAYEKGSDPDLISEAFNNLGAVKYELGKYDDALSLYQRALKSMETTLGPDAPGTSVARMNLAGTYERLGQSALAQPLYIRSVNSLERVRDDQPARLGDALANLANFYLGQGEMSRAVPLVQRAVVLKQKQYGEQHFEVARTMNNLGAIYSKMAQYDKAEDTLKKTLQILEKTLGPDHVDVARGLTNLAEVEKKQKRFDQAEIHYNRALKIRETALGPDHLDVATTLEHLGSFYQRAARYPEATAAAEQALKIRREKLGNDQLPVAYCLSSLATIALCQNKSLEAEDLFKQALQIRQQRLPAHHNELAESNALLGWVYANTGRLDLSLESFDKSRRGIRGYVEQVLSVLSEPEQITFLKNVDQQLYHAALSSAYLQKTQKSIDTSATWVINSKGAAQQILAQKALVSRDATNPVLANISQNLVAVRKQLATFALAGFQTADQKARRQKMDELSRREAEIARQMDQIGGRLVLKGEFVELDAVRKNIADDAALIEITRFRVNDFRDPVRETFPERYVAWIIPPAGEEQVKFIDLGPVEPIDELIFRLREKLTNSLTEIRESGETDAEQELKKSMEPLARLILEPIVAGLGDKQKVYLSPDSNLWIVPWCAMSLSDGKYAVEKFDFRFVISGRDLIPPERKAGAVSRPILFADPNYDLTPTEVQAATQELFKRVVETGPVHAIPATLNRLGQMIRLPGTQKEAKAILPKIELLANTEAYLYSDKWALEAVFKSLQKPQILVLSTHGFFLEAALDKDSTESANPLLRCGLLLAGCNKPSTLMGDGIEDGILTGLEIVATDLRDTDLVVLSACETGLGQVQNGEGVAGLRQAFQLAGARTVVATLWQIPDSQTSDLMTDFFSQLSGGVDHSAALRNAQLKMIAARRERDGSAHPYFWGAFTITGR